jgi:predicted MPP superfamily phosphohydrolase
MEDIPRRSPKTRVLPYLVSQSAWIPIILTPLVLSFFFPRYHPAQVYNSQPAAPWNASADPMIIVHATDIHLAASEPAKILSCRVLLQYMNFYQPDFHIISGDIIDDYGEKNWPKIGRQIPEDWAAWRRLKSEFGPNM